MSGKIFAIMSAVDNQKSMLENNLMVEVEKDSIGLNVTGYEIYLAPDNPSIITSNARLVVSDVAVCKKQDLVALIPEPPKTQPKSKLKKKKPEPEVEDPIHGRVSGVYNLRVAEVNRQGKKCLYVLEDAKGRKYNAQSSTYYAEGKIIGCQVNTLITGRGHKETVMKVGGSRYHKKRQERDGLQTHTTGWKALTPATASI